MPLLPDGRYSGLLYRALNPVHAREPLSGFGAGLHGGRFNPKGMLALYTSIDPSTALREANQVGNVQPTVLVFYRADLGPIFDTRDTAALNDYGQSAGSLADSGWRTAMLERRTAPSQEFARALVADGFAGLLVRSFAKGTSASNLNLVLWRWRSAGCMLEVIDDEKRLERM